MVKMEDIKAVCPCGEEMVIDDMSLPIIVLRAIGGWLSGTILQHCPRCGERMGEGYDNASDLSEFNSQIDGISCEG